VRDTRDCKLPSQFGLPIAGLCKPRFGAPELSVAAIRGRRPSLRVSAEQDQVRHLGLAAVAPVDDVVPVRPRTASPAVMAAGHTYQCSRMPLRPIQNDYRTKR
jgi:hypothetical protein